MYARSKPAWQGLAGLLANLQSEGFPNWQIEIKMAEFHLDIGAGIDAEHWRTHPVREGVRLVAMDPLLTSSMVASGRLASVPPHIRRVGAEVRPTGSVEPGKARSFLPFRSDCVTHIHCGYVLHLYLEILELLVAEAWRVLRPAGTIEILVAHLGNDDSAGILQRTERELRHWFAEVEVEPFRGPCTTFWADLYRDRTFRLSGRKGD